MKPPPSPSSLGSSEATTTAASSCEAAAATNCLDEAAPAVAARSSVPSSPPRHKLTPLEEEKIFRQMKNCDPIRYAAYRTAVKLDILQQALKLGCVKFGVVANVFHHHGLTSAENDVVLDAVEAADIAADIFFATSKIRSCYSPAMDVDALTEAALRFAGLVYYGDDREKPEDEQLQAQIPRGILFRQLMTFFVCLSEGRLRDKMLYLFRQFADAGGVMSRRGLSCLLSTLSKIPEFFGESVSFGASLVEGSVVQCFSRFASGGTKGLLGEEEFTQWLILEPQILVWLPTHFRLICARGVRHGTGCSSCKMEDIIGMRYQCLRCLGYDLCQHCFFYGHTSRSHRLQHPMREYCYRSTKKDAAKAFLTTLANNLRRRKQKHMGQRYLCPLSSLTSVANEGGSNGERSAGSSDESSGFHSETSSTCEQQQDQVDPRVAYDPASASAHTIVRENELGQLLMSSSAHHRKELHSIVLHMETHNNEMLENLRNRQQQQRLEALDRDPWDSCVSMQVQLNRLKALMDNVFGGSGPDGASQNRRDQQQPSSGPSPRKRRSILGMSSLNDPSVIESTPMVKKTRSSAAFLPVEKNFSPIVYFSNRQQQHKANGNHRSSPKGSNGIMTNGTIRRSLNMSSSKNKSVGQSTTMLLSDLSMGDLSSLLVKTGVPMEVNGGEHAVDDLAVTRRLGANSTSDDDDGMEEMEALMLKLDKVFQTFREINNVDEVKGAKAVFVADGEEDYVCSVVSELSQQMHNFAYQFRIDNDIS